MQLNDGDEEESESEPNENDSDDGDDSDDSDDSDDVEQRRLVIIGRDDREVQRSRRYPQNNLGLITFDGGRICSGTKVSKKHILTAGHCCHSGGRSGSFFEGWKWYPGVLKKSEVKRRKSRHVLRARAFNAWIRSRNRDYDICWLTLSRSYNGFLGYGWSNRINKKTSFDFWGYPGDKFRSARRSGLIKWGCKNCKPNKAVLTNQLHYTCDTVGGQSGSGLYQKNNKVYCVHTFGVRNSHNGCSRITKDKFTQMVNDMRAERGW